MRRPVRHPQATEARPLADTDRAALRQLQDTWLALPPVRYQITNYGWNYPIQGQGTPTLREVRECVLPGWAGFFRSYLPNEGTNHDPA